MLEITDTAAWQARAALCELLALTFRYPTEELVSAVETNEWIDAAREISEAVGLELPAGALEGPCLSDSAEDVLHALRVEATYLFVATPEFRVNPYEGAWRAKAEGRDFFAFIDPHSVEVEHFARACGLGQPKGKNEPLDNIATELELLQYLALMACGSIIVDESDEEELPGGSASAAYRRFVEDHASKWMGEFAEAVAETSRLPIYRMAAKLLESFVKNDF